MSCSSVFRLAYILRESKKCFSLVQDFQLIRKTVVQFLQLQLSFWVKGTKHFGVYFCPHDFPGDGTVEAYICVLRFLAVAFCQNSNNLLSLGATDLNPLILLALRFWPEDLLWVCMLRDWLCKYYWFFFFSVGEIHIRWISCLFRLLLCHRVIFSCSNNGADSVK